MISNIGNHYLYRHIRLDKNEPFYIGIGTKRKDYSNYQRDYSRAYNKQGRNHVWKRIVNKTDYEVEILLESDNYDFIKEKEQEFIALYCKIIDNTGILANFTDGGDGTLGVSPDKKTKEQISKNSIKYKVAQYCLDGEFLRLWDSVKQISEYYKCTKTPIYNCLNGKYKTCQDTQLIKIFVGDTIPEKVSKIKSSVERVAEKHRGVKLSKEHKMKISKANTGNVVSEETKEKLRQHNLGNIVKEETKKRLSKSLKGKDGIKVKYLKTNKIYNSLANACRKLSLNYKTEYAAIKQNYSTKKFIIIE